MKKEDIPRDQKEALTQLVSAMTSTETAHTTVSLGDSGVDAHIVLILSEDREPFIDLVRKFMCVRGGLHVNELGELD